jgi:hypothetical protein
MLKEIAGQVVFKQAGDSTLYQFSAELFKVDGKLPRPG